MSNLNRVQAGIPEGGQFLEATKTRPNVSGLDIDGRRLDVDQYDSVNLEPFDDFDEARVTNVGGDEHIIVGTKTTDFAHMNLGNEYANAPQEEKAAYLNARQEVVSDFINYEYGSRVSLGHGSDWAETPVVFWARANGELGTVEDVPNDLRHNTKSDSFSGDVAGDAFADRDTFEDKLAARLRGYDKAPLEQVPMEKYRVDHISTEFTSALVSSVDQDGNQLLNPESEARLREFAGSWCQRHSGDLQEWAKDNDASPRTVGKKLAKAARGGSGFHQDCGDLNSKVIAARLDSSADELSDVDWDLEPDGNGDLTITE
ncbi:hypothetical protein GCM10009689_18500 [Brevibacterium antiquum]|uniref:hypothetical protein n=1 Tax=Brevibacterium antiquum TaxID=234835 RepID=UPI0018DF2AB6|nr:hypothetical protein [Brevibacterium antiquum]